jgi:hypothetical protein
MEGIFMTKLLKKIDFDLSAQLLPCVAIPTPAGKNTFFRPVKSRRQ